MTGIRVLLTGGPTTLTHEDRIQEVPSLTEKVKVVRGNCREHFVYSGDSQEVNGTRVPVFHWCDRTQFAE